MTAKWHHYKKINTWLNGSEWSKNNWDHRSAPPPFFCSINTDHRTDLKFSARINLDQDLTLGFRHLCDEVLRNWIVYLFPDVRYKTAISFHTTPKLILGANWPRRRRDLKPQQTNKPKFIPFQKRTSDSLARQTLESNTNRNRTTQWCPANCTECTKKSVWCDACSFDRSPPTRREIWSGSSVDGGIEVLIQGMVSNKHVRSAV